MQHRLLLSSIGLITGLALWFFVDWLTQGDPPLRLALVSMALVLGFCATLLVLLSEVALRRAAMGAGLLAGAAGGLFWLALLRFSPTGFDLPFVHVFAFALILFIGTPFVLAGAQTPRGARNYALLFELAWRMVMRLCLGLVFVVGVWLLVWLSDVFLKLVGIPVIGDLLEIEQVPFALSGLFLGFALSLVDEMRDHMSPDLVLRLLRVLLPPLVVIVGVFLLALPFRGIDGLFGGWSTAVTLSLVAVVGISLVTAAVERADGQEVVSPVLRLSAQITGAMILPLAISVAVAVWVRVATYGWTPDRLAASFVAAILLAYGIGYLVVIVARRRWMARLREVNRLMALVVLAAAALWLSPLVNAEKISTQSQIARFDAGRSSVRKIPLWEMDKDWGLAGQAGLSELENRQDPELKRRIERVAEASSRWAFQNTPDLTRKADVVKRITELLWVAPGSAMLSASDLSSLDLDQLIRVQNGCMRMVDGRPGCALFLSQKRDGESHQTGLLAVSDGFRSNVSMMAVMQLEPSGTAQGTLKMRQIGWEKESIFAEMQAGVILENRVITGFAIGDQVFWPPANLWDMFE